MTIVSANRARPKPRRLVPALLAVAILPAATVAALAPVAVAQTSPPTAPPSFPPTSPPTSRPALRTDLPAAKTLVDRAVEAAGGARAMKTIKTVKYTVVASTAGSETRMSLRSAGPDKLLVNAETPGGQVEMGRMGKVAWTNTGNGYALVPEDRIGQVSQLDLYGLMLTLDDRAKDFTTVDELQFAETRCYKVQMAEEPGATFGYFDVKDGTMRGIDQSQASPMGQMLITTTFSEPKRVEPLTLFTQAQMSAGPQPLATLTFTDVEFNPADDFAITMPPEVADLVAKRKSAGATSRPGATASGPTSQPKSTKSGDPDSPAVRKMLASLQRMTAEDLGQLQMMASLIDAQVAQVDDAAEKANMQFLVTKIRERIAELEGE